MASISELIHGKKPEVAKFIPTDPIEMLKKLLAGEIKDWPQIQELGNLFQTDVFQKLSQAGLDLKSLISLGGEDARLALEGAAPLLKGQIPADVAQQVMRSSAFQSLGAGTLGGPMGSALAARNLGLTSLDLMKQGTGMAEAGGNAAQRWAGIAGGTMLPAASQLYSPQWFTQFMAQQSAAKQATKQFQYNVEAAPDPSWSARAKLLATYGGMALGGGMGGGGGASSALNYESVPAGGMGGSWANFTGQPYDTLGSGSGANASIMYNAPPMQYGPSTASYNPFNQGYYG